MIRVFIGWDPREAVAFDVLQSSIHRNSSQPVSITPLIKSQLSTKRVGGSTEFAFSRFLVPWLCDYEGHAIFMDCDMLCTGDIDELWRMRSPAYRIDGPAVQVVKHDYRPTETVKFLGAPQQQYDRKNWSSVMLFDNSKCRALTPEYVEKAPGLDLHQFKWCQRIGELPKEWNYLVGHSEGTAKIVHYTLGGPWFKEYEECDYADQWFLERDVLASRFIQIP
jgi:lipopolysaccharide biosynthesis glycosyltransferase